MSFRGLFALATNRKVYKLCKAYQNHHLLVRKLTSSAKKISIQHHKHGSDQRKGRGDADDITKIRNIGIMAHIDAGKTTTTERMLFYSGFTRHIGDVDDGDTVTDYMDQERERGITITAAAISFFWKKHKINLIDTPGHVDFTVEVERSLRVLDGVITVLDASAGVEAQTLTVWRQAEKYNIPKIVYLNKMDKNGADFHESVISIEDKLNAHPLVIQLPIGSEKHFEGLIDLVSMTCFVWGKGNSDGTSFKSEPLTKASRFYEEAVTARTKLIEQLANVDEVIADYFLSDTDFNKIPISDIQSAIRRCVLSHKGVPVLCGSSFKNKGIQVLMNAVVDYLPNPTERHHDFIEYYKDELCALAFKIIHDKQRGPLTFLRIYSGRLDSNGTLYNVNRESKEKISRLLQIFADDHKELNSASAGNIVAVSGLKETITGDTLVSSKTAVNNAKKLFKKAHNKKQTLEEEEEDITPVLAGVQIPDPVFFCAIEPYSLAHQKPLEKTLEIICREDPSLKVHVDPETAQTILSGMGELHLEVIHKRINTEFGVEADLGPLQIAYKETILESIRHELTLDKMIGNSRNIATIELSVSPAPSMGEQQKHLEFEPVNDFDPKRLRRQVIKALENGMKSGLSRGPLLGFNTTNIEVKVHNFRSARSTTLPMITACMAQCLSEALQKATCVLLEPMMELEINTDEDYASAVLSDLSQRRSQIFDIESRNNSRVVLARVPLSELMGYSTKLRTITSGTSTFSMQLHSYERMTEYDQKMAIEKVTGFATL